MRIAAFGDLHAPWTDLDALSWAFSVLDKLTPSKSGKGLLVCQVGDLYDFYSFSGRFPISRNVITPAEELYEGRKFAENFWKQVKKRAPLARCVQIRGNHCIRPEKYAAEAFPPAETLMRDAMHDLFKFKGVETHFDVRKELVINQICFMHGHYTQLGKHVRFNQMNTIHGHTHRGGVHLEPIHNAPPLWELDCGYLGDHRAAPLSFTRQTWTRWTKGLGIVDDFGPRFIAYPGSQKKKAR